MKITKSIVLAFDVGDAIGIFTDEANILHLLNEKYAGKCTHACLVASVDRIIRRGDCTISQDGSASTGTIPVECEVTAHVFESGEVINGCHVRHIGITLICDTAHANINCNIDDTYKSVVIGQTISVQVVAARYFKSTSKICVHARPYKHSDKCKVYRINVATPVVVAIVAPVLARARAEQELAAATRAAHPQEWQTFATLLQPYKEAPASGQLDVMTLIDTKATVYACRDPHLNLATSDVRTCEPTTCTESTSQGLIALLESYRNHLRTIREMVEIYNTPDMIKSHKNIWVILNKGKFTA